jgi:F0F1-type ATP synthase epsilon subunit
MLRADGSWQNAVVDGGFLHVSSEGGATRADVLASHAELADEIDVAAARRNLEEWQNKTQENDDSVAKAEIAKSLARISLAG